MTRIKKFINKLSKTQKIIYLCLILCLAILLSIGIPTLARYMNRSTINTVSVWDGTVATSYRKGTGTVNDPYIISNGSELAYFSTQLLNNNYENIYFSLSNDIVLNNGIFNYDSTNGIQYTLNSQTYYVDDYTNKYYDNIDYSGTEIGTINIFNSLDNFKGYFNGNSFRIYGLYLTSESDNIALFTNLEGNVKDLYVENSLIYGGITTAGIASNTNNASLSNILFDGYVIGKNTLSNKNISTIPTSSIINIQNTETTNYIDLTNNIPFIGSEVISTSITGNYVINGSLETETSIKINGTTVSNGSFEIDLGSTILNNIPIITSTTTEGEVTLTFTNLSYNIVYKYGVSGGIIGNSNNTTIENTINKAYVYGYSTSGGIVGVTTNSLNINQSYNTGNIDSEHVSGGLIGTIEKSSNNIVISKNYNTGDMNATDIGGLIGVINNSTGSISINNVFNTSTTNYSIGTIENTTVNITNAYFVNGVTAINNGTATGSFALTTLDNLKIKEYVNSNLSFSEFVDFDDILINNQNVWVYNKDSLPILFIDDISNPIANIHVGIYSWNNVSYELSPVELNSNITFSIENADELIPVKEKYYYISNSNIPLTKEEISQISTWTPYSNIEQITVEGYYVIYAKIVDYDDNVTYINTDLLMLDLPGSSANISIEDNTWSNLRDSLNYIYIDREKYVTVESNDSLSDITSIKYYITSNVLSTTDLNLLDDSNWTTYSNPILINEIGTHVIYIKLVDSFDYVSYINTDYIVFNGYTETMNIGRNASSYLNVDPYINDKSTITLNIDYSNSSNLFNNHTHNLISNILLPMGTKITLIDNIKEKVYQYKITTDTDIYNYNNSCDIEDLDCIKVATYPFTLFKEIRTNTNNFSEDTYYTDGIVNEDFTIVLDFYNTNISTNYTDVSLYMELHDSNGINVRPTLYSEIKKFNIYYNKNASLNLSTSYNGDAIIYNSDSSTDINITSKINYEYVNGYKVIDTTYEDKEMGLSIKLVDSNGNIIDKEYLKNILFKIGDSTYYPEEDNIVRINLNNGIIDTTKVLTINTYNNNGNLNEGTYYFKISNYVAEDGHYYDELNNNELSIPVNVSDNNNNITYGFNVIMDDTNRIIGKTNPTVNASFSILLNSTLTNPNIRISLYKKDQLTAYNQSYSIVDLASYVSDSLSSYASNIYYVSTNPNQNNTPNIFELNLITANFENNGYRFVFDLYDGTKKIGTIEKNFIVK